MRAAAIALSLCLLLSGCRKKSAPEFYRFESDYSILVTRDGDAAYDDPDMAAIVAGLRGISAEAMEKPKADALLATIEAEMIRVHRESGTKAPVAAANPAGADSLYANLQQQRQQQAADTAAAAVVAAKVVEPVKGMSEADFIKAFGACFEKSGPVTLPEGGEATSQRPLNTPECQQKWGIAVWIFGARGLIGKLVENNASSSSTETRVLDAGRPAQPAPPPQIDTGIVIPGRPSGNGTPPPSVDDKTYLNDTPPPTVTPPAQ